MAVVQDMVSEVYRRSHLKGCHCWPGCLLVCSSVGIFPLQWVIVVMLKICQSWIKAEVRQDFQALGNVFGCVWLGLSSISPYCITFLYKPKAKQMLFLLFFDRKSATNVSYFSKIKAFTLVVKERDYQGTHFKKVAVMNHYQLIQNVLR